ncbi:MAG: HYR domain-containing protein [Flavobacteriaceae bacterium]
MMKRNKANTLLICLVNFIFLGSLNAQLSQSFEGVATTLNCGNTSCLYTDPDSAALVHFLADNNGVPVSLEGNGSSLGFKTEFTPSRSGASGQDGLTDGDAFGIAGSNQVLSELGLEQPAGEQAFLMEDTDGQVSLYFDHVYLDGTTAPAISLEYMLSDTAWESSSGQNDRFYVRVEIDNCASATTITLLDSDGGGSGGNSGGDIDELDIEGVWKTLSSDLSEFVDCRARLIIEFDSNSSAEVLGIDNIIFTEGSSQPMEMNPVEVPDLIGLTAAAAEDVLDLEGLITGTISTEYSDLIEIDKIISQQPMAGTTVTAGDTVDIVVSLGPFETVPPDIICPADIEVSNGADQCGAVVNYELFATCESDSTELIISPPSGSFFEMGTTVVNVSITDEAGNTSHCSFNVTVVDNQAPVLACPEDVLISIPEGETLGVVTYPEPVVSDNCPGTTIVTVPATGTICSIGTTEVMIIATDTAGNIATCGFNVVIEADVARTNSVTGFVLVDAENNRDIMTLEEGWVVDLLALPRTNFNIRANVTRDVGSVALRLTGAIKTYRTENKAPFSLFGDSGGNYYSGHLPIGSYELTATPYTRSNLGGLTGTPLTINFTIIESSGGGFFLKLYPNPAVNEISLSMSELTKDPEIFSIRVHDMQGKLIRTYESKELSGTELFKIPTYTLPSGIYFLTAFGDRGTVEKKTFVVDK